MRSARSGGRGDALTQLYCDRPLQTLQTAVGEQCMPQAPAGFSSDHWRYLIDGTVSCSCSIKNSAQCLSPATMLRLSLHIYAGAQLVMEWLCKHSQY